MKKIFFALFLVSVFTPNKSLEINQNFVTEFMKRLHLNHGIIFFCNGALDIFGWRKTMMKELKYFSFFDISSNYFNLNESWTFMRFTNRRVGIIFELTCSETEEVFGEFSFCEYFNASYNWLMLSNNFNESVELLSAQNINLDAEITLAVRSDIDDICLLYDVYNPSYKMNGKLIMEPKGTWYEIDGINFTLNGSKFDRRANLHGIQIHSGVVASGDLQNQTLLQYMESQNFH